MFALDPLVEKNHALHVCEPIHGLFEDFDELILGLDFIEWVVVVVDDVVQGDLVVKVLDWQRKVFIGVLGKFGFELLLELRNIDGGSAHDDFELLIAALHQIL